MATQLTALVIDECEARKSYFTEWDINFIAGIRAKLVSGEEITPREHRQIGGYLEFIATHEPDAPPA